MVTQKQYENMLDIEKALKLVLYSSEPISSEEISIARLLRMISFIGMVKASPHSIDLGGNEEYELYFIFDRYVALDMDDNGTYTQVWTLFAHEVQDLNKMVEDAENLLRDQ